MATADADARVAVAGVAAEPERRGAGEKFAAQAAGEEVALAAGLADVQLVAGGRRPSGRWSP